MMRSILFSLAVAALLPACSGSTDDGGQSTASLGGLAGDVTLAELDDAQNDRLCVAAATLISAPEWTCQLTGVSAARELISSNDATTDVELQSACTAAESNCHTADPGTSKCERPASTCVATVAEYEACVSQLSAQLEDSAAQAPRCSSMTKSALAASPPVAAGGSSACTTFEKKCPGGYRPDRPGPSETPAPAAQNSRASSI